MSELREKMIKAMELRNFSPNTQKAYLSAVTNLAMHYMKSPQEISQVEVEDYLLYLKKERKLSYSTRNQAISGLKFFYNETLKNPDMVLQLPRKKTPVKLPEVLSIDEVKRVINAPSNIKHRMILMTTYSAGLRVSELVRLEPRHIVSSRMLILVEDGKGVKDRYTILSKNLLENLRNYWQSHRPTKWLFPSTDQQRHISRSTAQKLFVNAKKKQE
jgi:site-specific recombinase XerD